MRRPILIPFLALLSLSFLAVGRTESESFYSAGIGDCPRGWKEAGHLCYKFVGEEMTFGKALKHCRDIRDNDFSRGHYYEDISAMLTLQDLHAFKRGGNRIVDFIWQDIWLNGIKSEGKVYSIHKVPWGPDATRPLSIIGYPDRMARVIAAPNTGVLFPDFDITSMDEHDALILNPGDSDNPTASLRSHHYKKHDHHFVCTHKRDRTDRYACPGDVTECNNNGYCRASTCQCYPKTIQKDMTCISGCPPNWVQVGTKCLLYSSFVNDGQKTRPDAITYCANNGGILFEPQTKAEEAAVGAALADDPAEDRDTWFWLGIDWDASTGVATYLSNGQPTPYIHWLPLEPSGDPNPSPCVHIKTPDVGWNDINCDNTNHAIAVCERPAP